MGTALRNSGMRAALLDGMKIWNIAALGLLGTFILACSTSAGGSAEGDPERSEGAQTGGDGGMAGTADAKAPVSVTSPDGGAASPALPGAGDDDDDGNGGPDVHPRVRSRLQVHDRLHGQARYGTAARGVHEEGGARQRSVQLSGGRPTIAA